MLKLVVNIKGRIIMKQLESLEKSLSDIFKNAPALPQNAKNSLVQYWPYIALVFAFFQIIAAIGLFRLLSAANGLIDQINTLSTALNGVKVGPSSFEKMIILVGVSTLAIDAIITIMAFKPLTEKLKKGWNLMFLAVTINLVYSVVQIFTYSRGIGQFGMGLIGSAISYYLLFQIKEFYHDAKSVPKA